MKEDLLKRKFIVTWQEICKIKGISPDIEIAYEELSNGYSKTPYPEINRRVTRLLRHNEFPDHYDIVELIERCNTKHNLGISVEEKAQLSREVFKDVGKVLKAHRAKDFKAHFGSHLTDEALKTKEDPASKDAELLEMLRKSLRDGQEKLEELCEGFVLKQEVEGEQERPTEGDACESDESAEEEEEEEEAEEGVEQGEELQVEKAEGQDGEEVIEESSDSEGSVDIDVEIAEEEVEQGGGGTERLSPTVSESSDESKEASGPVSSDAGISVPLDSPVSDEGQKDSNSNGDGEEENVIQLPMKRKMSEGEEERTKKAKMATDDSEDGDKMTTSSLGNEREQNKTPPITSTIILLDDDEDDDDVIVLSD
jgi:hypothetical protein